MNGRDRLFHNSVYSLVNLLIVDYSIRLFKWNVKNTTTFHNQTKFIKIRVCLFQDLKLYFLELYYFKYYYFGG